MNYYLTAWKKFATFNGRATRAEYWYFVLFNFIIGIIINFIDTLIGTSPFLYVAYWLAIFIPTIAVLIRRLHDTNRSGWMILVSLIPIIGTIWLFILLIIDSKEDNKYGPNPKKEKNPSIYE